MIIFGRIWYLKKDVINREKIVYICLTMLNAFLLVVSIPFLINESYLGNIGYVTMWEAKDVLSFYGSLLSFIGTVFLGALALWQNYQYKRQADEFSELQLRPYINIFNSNVCPSLPLLDILKAKNTDLTYVTLRLQNVGTSNILDIKCSKYFIDDVEIEITNANEDKLNFIATKDIQLVNIPWTSDKEQFICMHLNVCNAVGTWYQIRYRLKISKINNSNIFEGKTLDIKRLKENK